MPQCTFAARAGRDGQLSVTANLYDGPQPYFILERTTVETAQLFTPKRMVPAPQAITGLGLEADWFPARNQLMSTDGIRLVTVSVDWPGTDQARQVRLAEALSRAYLRVPGAKKAEALAKGYPSGG